MQDVKAEDLICIDETGVWQGMKRSLARSECGKRVFSHRPFYKGQKYTVIGAISVDGIVCLKTIQGSMKGEDFLTFIKDDLVPKLRPQNRVVMDNLTYSPDFNPIEMMWSAVFSSILTVLLKLHDIKPNAPVPHGQPYIDGF